MEKSCLGKWDTCPESKGMGLCKKLRSCILEISCMKEWLKIKSK